LRSTWLVASATGVALLAMAALVGRAAEAPAAKDGLATLVVAQEAAPTERLLDGTVEAINQSTVSAQTAGRVTGIYFDVNDVVPAGALIMSIRSTEQVSNLTQAQAALNEATARCCTRCPRSTRRPCRPRAAGWYCSAAPASAR